MSAISRFTMLLVLLASALLLNYSTAAMAEDNDQSANDAHTVLAPFIDQDKALGEAVAIEDKQKHLILFYMGVSLLFLVLTTAVIGLQMAVFGKQLFVQHMISAGFTVFLALAHAVTAIVWFFPFK